MSLIFIPTHDYHRSAHEADNIVDFELGPVRIGSTASFSFRIGNTGSDAVTWSLSVNGDEPDRWELPDGTTLQPGETTDTLTVRLNLPLDAVEMGVVCDLMAYDGTTYYPMQVDYEAMGSNSSRRANYPRRAGQATDAASNVIDSLGDILKLIIFDPIPYNPNAATGYGQPVTFQSLGAERETLAGYKPIRVITGNDPCDRLNPNDTTYGYTQDKVIIQGQFSRETRETRTFNLTATDTEMEYQIGASLAFVGEDELVREWALFEEATELEPAQYKRSVFLIQRLGELWSIENIRTLDKGDELSHFEADLVALHSRHIGAPDFWNPFAITYQYESDKPYGCYTCTTDYSVADFEDVPTGSEWANPSSYEEPEQPVAPLPVSVTITQVGSIWRAVVTFDSALTSATLVTSDWRIYTGTWKYYPATAIAAGTTVTLETSLASLNLPSALPPQVTYSAATPDLVGANGATVEAFQILE